MLRILLETKRNRVKLLNRAWWRSHLIAGSLTLLSVTILIPSSNAWSATDSAPAAPYAALASEIRSSLGKFKGINARTSGEFRTILPRIGAALSESADCTTTMCDGVTTILINLINHIDTFSKTGKESDFLMVESDIKTWVYFYSLVWGIGSELQPLLNAILAPDGLNAFEANSESTLGDSSIIVTCDPCGFS